MVIATITNTEWTSGLFQSMGILSIADCQMPIADWLVRVVHY